MRYKSKRPLFYVGMAWLLCLSMGLVVLDSLFGITANWWSKAPIALHGYVGTPLANTIQIPMLVGTCFSAEDLPSSSVLLCDVTYVYHPTAPPTTIVSQSPMGGALRKVSPNDPAHLSLVVSMGKETTPLPSLEGWDVREAERLLGQMGLAYQRVYVPSYHNQEVVISTYPPKGTPMERGQAVELQVSQIPTTSTHTCPDLTGLTLEEAQYALWRAGLTLGDVEEEIYLDPWHMREGDSIGVVISQDHPPHSLLPDGYPVGVKINSNQ